MKKAALVKLVLLIQEDLTRLWYRAWGEAMCIIQDFVRAGRF